MLKVSTSVFECKYTECANFGLIACTNHTKR